MKRLGDGEGQEHRTGDRQEHLAPEIKRGDGDDTLATVGRAVRGWPLEAASRLASPLRRLAATIEPPFCLALIRDISPACSAPRLGRLQMPILVNSLDRC
ncbi:hypothetical protein [Mesorhizobium sp. LCM 4577]|uniref:hypothetical protein n=1 Tax=Mesorhizobium sp. LCM 4577 TaxID=1848288 RepID=UPI0030838DAC